MIQGGVDLDDFSLESLQMQEELAGCDYKRVMGKFLPREKYRGRRSRLPRKDLTEEEYVAAREFYREFFPVLESVGVFDEAGIKVRALKSRGFLGLRGIVSDLDEINLHNAHQVSALHFAFKKAVERAGQCVKHYEAQSKP